MCAGVSICWLCILLPGYTPCVVAMPSKLWSLVNVVVISKSVSGVG